MEPLDIVVDMYDILDEIVYHINSNCLTQGDINEAQYILAKYKDKYNEHKKGAPSH